MDAITGILEMALLAMIWFGGVVWVVWNLGRFFANPPEAAEMQLKALRSRAQNDRRR